MPVELVLAPEAESDIAEAYAWYEDRRAGLGEEFLSSVDEPPARFVLYLNCCLSEGRG